jgi:tRNA pseudouridine(54/55) synthase
LEWCFGESFEFFSQATVGSLELRLEFHHEDEMADVALLDIQTSTKKDRGKKRWKPQYKKRRLDGEGVADNYADEQKQEEEDEDKARMPASVESGRSVSRFFEKHTVRDLLDLPDRKFDIPPKSVHAGKAFASVTIRHNATNLLMKYHKYSRELSQTRWIKGGSVEELIVGPLLKLFGTQEFKFSSAGREDADVRMLGEGRHCVIQFQDPHNFPSNVKEIEEAVNSSSKGLIGISHVSIHYNDAVLELLKEGEESKRKRYRAVIWVENPSPDALKSLPEAPFQIIQGTPIRVAHRRSLLDRPKMVYNLEFEKLSTHFYVMDVDTGAGMYIKEFVHGDRGRTVPSVAEFFGCNADILQLDVLDIVKDE